MYAFLRWKLRAMKDEICRLGFRLGSVRTLAIGLGDAGSGTGYCPDRSRLSACLVEKTMRIGQSCQDKAEQDRDFTVIAIDEAKTR